MSRKLVKSIPGNKDGKGAYTKDAPFIPDEFKLEEFLFDKQLKFVTDPRAFKVAVCSRRSGKTVACAADLIQTALLYPETNSLYITLSRSNAKKLIWPEIQRINRNYGLGGKSDDTELSIAFPNGAIIYLSGAKDQSEIEKFRGLSLKKVYIDECQSFRAYLRELIDDVIAPALLDYAGSLCLIGTPGPVPTGYFAEVAGVVKGKEASSTSWASYGWTFFDNPFIAAKSQTTHEALLQRELKRRGVKAEDPSIQREFFGRWVLDSDSLLLTYQAETNHFDALPTLPNNEQYNYILGIDLGYEDADALAVLAWSSKAPTTYLVKEKIVRKQGLTELVEEINKLKTIYPITKMIIDEGGLGKKLAEEMRRRHHLPVQAAEKVRKMETMAFLNDALRTGRFKADQTSTFAQECFLVEIDRAKSTPDKIKVSDKYHSDIIDAVLYAFKESPAFTYQAEPDKPKPGDPNWSKYEQDRMFEEELEYINKQNERTRENGGFDPNRW